MEPRDLAESIEKVELLPPTWLGILPVLLNALDAKLNTKAAEGAYIELKRMAEQADKFNEHLRAEHGA